MRDFLEFLEPYDFFIVRTPLLPVAFRNQTVCAQLLRDNPVIGEALLVASPDLPIEKYISNELSDKDKKHLERSLLKFLIRMSCRATPFGLFAGVALGKFSSETNLQPGPGIHTRSRLDNAFFFQIINALLKDKSVRHASRFEKNNTLYRRGDSLRYFSYYLAETRQHYTLEQVRVSQPLLAVLETASAAVDFSMLVQVLNGMGYDKRQSVRYLDLLIQEKILISELYPRITGPVSPLDSLLEWKTRHPSIRNPLLTAVSKLDRLLDSIDSMPLGRRGETYRKFYALAQKVSARCAPGPSKKKNVFLQLDSHRLKEQNFLLDSAVLENLKQAVHILAHIGHAGKRSVPASDLDRFKEEFFARYEYRSVPLSQVLDPEEGIGYPADHQMMDQNPIRDQIRDQIRFGSEKHRQSHYITSDWHAVLLNLYTQSLAKKSLSVELTSDHVKNQMVDNIHSLGLPESLYSVVRVLSHSSRGNANGQVGLVHVYTTGPSFVKNVARFCSLDPSLEEAVSQTTRDEQLFYKTNYDAILAEIVFCDQYRNLNVELRPVFNEFEIALFNHGSAREDKRITLEDIFVSYYNNDLILTSRKLGKRIIPRLSTSQNYLLSQSPIYRFLGDMQYQHLNTNLYFDWGAFEFAPFLPRIEYKNIVLSLAQWNIDLKEFGDAVKGKSVDGKSGHGQAFAQVIGKLKTQLSLPDSIVVGDHDQLLELNLNDPWQVEILHEYVEKLFQDKQSFLSVKESMLEPVTLPRKQDSDQAPLDSTCPADHTYTQPTDCTATDSNSTDSHSTDCYAHELVVPWKYNLANSSLTTPMPATNSALSDSTVRRTFHVGSQWLYFKLYCGIQVIERILTDHLLDLVNRLSENGWIDKWHFVRLKDEQGNHLRLRFLINGANHESVIELIRESFRFYLDQNSIWNMQIDSYNRELERYGAELIEETETLFCHDSLASVELLGLVNDYAKQNKAIAAATSNAATSGSTGPAGDTHWTNSFRERVSLLSIDAFFDDFHCSLQEKILICDWIASSYKKEFNLSGKQHKEQLATLLRRYRPCIDDTFSNQNDPWLLKARQILSERSARIAPIKEKLLKNDVKPLDNRLSSYLHMHINRMFVSGQRKHEMILFDWLHKHYISLQKKRK